MVTNIEADHLEYYKTFETIVEAFRIFVGGVKRGRRGHRLRATTSTWRDCSVMPKSAASATGLSEARRPARGEPPVQRARLVVRSAGRRLLQALHPRRAQRAQRAGGDRRRRASSASTRETIAAGLAKFLGVDRRFQILGDYHGAHRRRRLRAPSDRDPRHARTPRAAAIPDRRIVALFQPHLYSRTRDFAREFGEALLVADVPIVAPIYAAREQPVDGVSARIISDAVEGVEFLDRSNARDRQRDAPPPAARTTSSSPWAPATSTRSPRSSCEGRTAER